MKPETLGIVVGVTAGTLLFSWLGYRAWRRGQQHPNPRKWRHLGSLGEIHFYPVKSAASIEVEEAICDVFGLKVDSLRNRCVVALDERRKFANAARYPAMSTIQPSLEDKDSLLVTAPNLDALTINLADLLRLDPVRLVQRAGFNWPFVLGNEEYHKWFSRAILGHDDGVRMLMALDPILQEGGERNVDRKLFRIKVLHKRTLQQLSKYTDAEDWTQPDPKPFRGDLIIDSNEEIRPYDEAKWLWLRIGNNPEEEVILRFKTDSVRFVLVNVDTSSIRQYYDPANPVKTYFLTTHPVYDVYKSGVLKKGAPVYVQYK